MRLFCFQLFLFKIFHIFWVFRMLNDSSIKAYLLFISFPSTVNPINLNIEFHSQISLSHLSQKRNFLGFITLFIGEVLSLLKDLLIRKSLNFVSNFPFLFLVGIVLHHRWTFPSRTQNMSLDLKQGRRIESERKLERL